MSDEEDEDKVCKTCGPGFDDEELEEDEEQEV